MFCKKVVLKFHKIHWKTPVLESLSHWRCRPKACNFSKKETLAQVFVCEFCEIFKNTFFTKHLWTTASESGKTDQISHRQLIFPLAFLALARIVNCICVNFLFLKSQSILPYLMTSRIIWIVISCWSSIFQCFTILIFLILIYLKLINIFKMVQVWKLSLKTYLGKKVKFFHWLTKFFAFRL